MTKKTNLLVKNVFLALLFIILIVTLIVIEFFNVHLFENSLASSMFENSILRFLGGVIFMVILFRLGFSKLFKFNKTLTPLILIIPALIISVNNFPISAYFNGRTSLNEPIYTIYIFALECISIGFFEEIIFRGLLLTLFLQKLPKSRKGVFGAIVLSSAVFGFIHALNLFSGASLGNTFLQIGYSFLIGMMWAVMYLKTKNIWLVMILHATYNFFGLVMFQLGDVVNRYDSITVFITVILSITVTMYSIQLFYTLHNEEESKIKVDIAL